MRTLRASFLGFSRPELLCQKIPERLALITADIAIRRFEERRKLVEKEWLEL